MDKIIDGLYLGDVFSCSNRYALRKFGITHILTMAKGMRPLYPNEFIYKWVDVYDAPNENLLSHWPKAIDFIKEAIEKGGNILVHWYAGVSRSASTVIAYLMVEKKVSFYNAATYVKKKRPIILPNVGFQKQLMKLEQILKKSNEIDDKVSITSKTRKPARKSQSQAKSDTR